MSIITKKTAKSDNASGTIVYNPNLDSWRCLDANGKLLLSTGSKQSAMKAFPNFTVKE